MLSSVVAFVYRFTLPDLPFLSPEQSGTARSTIANAEELAAGLGNGRGESLPAATIRETVSFHGGRSTPMATRVEVRVAIGLAGAASPRWWLQSFVPG